MSEQAISAFDADWDSWPQVDPEGRPVRFTSRDSRPRRDEFTPTLEGESVRLDPLGEEHFDRLCEIGLDPELTRFMPVRLTTRELMAEYIHDAIAARDSFIAIPFVVLLKDGSNPARAVGSTRFLNIAPVDRRKYCRFALARF